MRHIGRLTAPEELIEAGANGVKIALFDEDTCHMERLIAQGIEGIEVFYPTYDRADIQHYMDIAQKHGLLVSGGSDYRGFVGRQPDAVGQFTIEDIYAENFYRPPHHIS